MIFSNLKCYNFVSQNVSSLPTGSLTFCSTNSQFINVRKDEKSKSIYVEISDLGDIELIQNRFQVPFKNVDKIIYCETGNYLAVVGVDFKNNTKICVYFNWWLEQKGQQTNSKCILNLYNSTINHQDRQSLNAFKPTLEYVEIKTAFLEADEMNCVKISCCERSGNLLIGHVRRVQIYKYFSKYSIDNRSLANNFIHLIDLVIGFNAEHFTLTEQLLLCSSTEHCQVINLDFKAEINLNSICQAKRQVLNSRCEDEEEQKENVEETIYLPIFQNEDLKVSNGHLNEIFGRISEKLCCRIDVKFDNCVYVYKNRINILFCLNLNTTKLSSIEHQFEIIEEDGYSQIHHKNKEACRTFLLPVYHRRSDDKQLSEDNPLLAIENQTQNLLHSTFNSKLIYFNFFVFKNDHLAYYLIDHNFKIEKFKLDQINIKNLNMKSVSIDESLEFIYILTPDALYTYYFGVFNILNNTHQPNFTSALNSNLKEMLKFMRPILLNKNSFLGSHQLIDTSVQLMVLSQDDQVFTKYSLQKPSPKQMLYDAKENLVLLEQEMNKKEKTSFCFYLVNLCKSIKLNSEMQNFYLDHCLILLRYLISNYTSSSAARKLIIEFVFKYTDLTLLDLIEKEEFLYRCYEEAGKSILEEILEQLLYEDKLNQSDVIDYYYEQQKQLSEKVLAKLDDLNVVKLIRYLNTNTDLVVYLVFKHRFNKTNWSNHLQDTDLFKCCITKSKILFDCEQFEELEKLIRNTNETIIYSELVNYKDSVMTSIDFLSCIVKLDLAKVIRFFHKLISSNISSEYIFSIFKDNKLLFILLDNYLCTTRSEQISEKLLNNLVVNYWKILNGEFNHDALCEELGLHYQWNVYQTPFINLLRPCREDDDVESDKFLNAANNNTFNKLQFILNIYSSNNEIKSLLNHLIKNSETSWSWRIQVQISEFSDAISILYDKRPETILFYVLEQPTMDNRKWTLLINFLNEKQKIHGLDSKLNHKVLYHLANILSPLEFNKLIPPEWKPIMNYYFRICLDKYRANCIKKQIMKCLDLDYKHPDLKRDRPFFD